MPTIWHIGYRQCMSNYHLWLEVLRIKSLANRILHEWWQLGMNVIIFAGVYLAIVK